MSSIKKKHSNKKGANSRPKSAKFASGKGDYKIPKKIEVLSIGKKSIGAHAGGFIGKMLGNKDRGASVGDYLHRGIKYFTGFGDYTQRQNGYNEVMEDAGHPTHEDAVLQGSPTKFREAANGVIVSGREFIGVVAGSVSFATKSYSLNPGMGDIGPWIPPIANSFEQYRIKAMIFEFRSTCSDYVGSGGNLGAIMMSTVYDPARLPYGNQVQVMNSLYSVSDKPTKSFYHMVECDPKQLPYKWYDVRNSSAPTNQDLRLSDVGFLQVSTAGMQTLGQVGELYVSYVYEFTKQIYVPQFRSQNTLFCSQVALAGNNILTAVFPSLPTKRLLTDAPLGASQNTLGVLMRSYYDGSALRNVEVDFAGVPAGIWLVSVRYQVDPLVASTAGFYTTGSSTVWDWGTTGTISAQYSALPIAPFNSASTGLYGNPNPSSLVGNFTVEYLVTVTASTSFPGVNVFTAIARNWLVPDGGVGNKYNLRVNITSLPTASASSSKYRVDNETQRIRALESELAELSLGNSRAPTCAASSASADEESKQDDLGIISQCDTPVLQAQPDLSESIHLSRGVLAKLLGKA